jgi:osmotically-inducible protein OsmY
MRKSILWKAGGFSPALVMIGLLVGTAHAGWDFTPEDPAPSLQERMPFEDSEITNAVELELLLDKGVSAHLIDVETDKGIVTLSGSVDNILSKERAEEITETIKGVRSVVNLIEVNPIVREDDLVRMDIERALLIDPATESYEVDVQVKDGMVTLTGTVESWAEKRLAGYVAKGVTGVRSLKNDIRIQVGPERSESEIKAEVKRQLEIRTLIDAGLIDVDVDGNKVILSGTVGSLMEKNRAFNAGWVAGVDEVDVSGLDVEFWAEDPHQRQMPAIRADDEIAEAVEDAMLYDPRVYSFEIDVEADEGMVTLAGTVDNLKAKTAAAQDARNTVGVWGVENDIVVRPLSPPSDADIARNLKDALLWNPYVERFELTVVVRNKKAYLYGLVDSEFEKREAGEVASRTNGVAAVENNIQVDEAWLWKPDPEIEEDIEQQLSWSVFVDEADVDVSVDNGIATLEGEVDSITELDAAIKDAFDGGARRVVNRLTIEDYPDYYPDLFLREYWWPYWPFWTLWPTM